MQDSYDIPRAALDALIRHVQRYGVEVKEVWEEPEGARFIGTFEGRTITLFPKYDSNFAMYFTVAHLYGHMVQSTRRTKADERSIALVQRVGQVLTHEEVQCVYDHELEAAALGRTLMADLGPVDSVVDRQYTRMFFADFHYLVNFLETGNGGIQVFDMYLRREPAPWRVIEPDPRPLVDLSRFAALAGSATVV